MEKLSVGIALLNWNGRALLERFLPSVTQYSPKGDVFLIDNASADDSVEFVRTHYPEIHIIQLHHNYGFSGGYNYGIQEIDRDIVVLLNTDVEVTENWISPVLANFQEEGVAAAMPKLLDLKRPEYFEYAGAAGGFLDKYGYPYCRGRLFDHIEKDEGQYDEPCEIHWASGAAFFVRKSAYISIGGLDEDFFAHMEEIDLCWRLRNAGFSIRYQPDSKVYHLGGATLNKISPRKTFLNFRNSLACFYLNTSPAHFWKNIFQRLLLDGMGGVYLLLTGKFSHFWAVVRSHFAFYGTFSKWKRKKDAQSLRKNFTDADLYKGSVALKTKLGGKQKFKDL